jgi:hypothetical protein
MSTVTEALRNFEEQLPAYEAGGSSANLPAILPDLVITTLDEESLPFPRIRPENPFAAPCLWERFLERAHFKIDPDSPDVLHPVTVYSSLWYRFESLDKGLFAHVGKISMELDSIIGRVRIEFDGYFHSHRITITLLQPNFVGQTFNKKPCGYDRCKHCKPVLEMVRQYFPTARLVYGRIRWNVILQDNSAVVLDEALGGTKASWKFCVWSRGLAEQE